MSSLSVEANSVYPACEDRGVIREDMRRKDGEKGLSANSYLPLGVVTLFEYELKQTSFSCLVSN